MNIDIYPAAIEDAKALIKIQKQAFKRLYDIYHDEGSPYLRGTDEIITWLERPNWHVYKIMADGVLCGGVSFCERNGMPGVYYLARIYILPEKQGKGIASTAILLCEKTVVNAGLWTLDYPADQAANRRCYEKAGYTDTGEHREQSGGAITLSFMEKRIPEFRNIKENPENLNNPVIRGILAGCLFDGSPEGIDKVIERYRANNSQNLYCWAENGEITGVCGFEAHSGYVEVLHIAVAESRRGCGIGSKMIIELRKRYGMALEAETDDDAVGFYRKCGFKTAAFIKYDTQRYKCVLSAPKT